MNTKTPETRAEERYPDPGEPMAERLGLIPDYKRRNDFRYGAATIIREQVEPLESEVQKLRALVQVGYSIRMAASEVLFYGVKPTPRQDLSDAIRAWDATAKAAGFTPITNTDDK